MLSINLMGTNEGQKSLLFGITRGSFFSILWLMTSIKPVKDLSTRIYLCVWLCVHVLYTMVLEYLQQHQPSMPLVLSPQWQCTVVTVNSTCHCHQEKHLCTKIFWKTGGEETFAGAQGEEALRLVCVSSDSALVKLKSKMVEVDVKFVLWRTSGNKRERIQSVTQRSVKFVQKTDQGLKSLLPQSSVETIP